MRLSLLVLLLGGCTPVTAAAAGDAPRTWRFATGPSAEVRIDNVSGRIDVAAAAGTEVVVEAVARGGSAADRARWQLEAEGAGSAVKFRARCGEGWHGCSSSAHVDVTVKAPAASRVAVHGVSADLAVTGMTGELQAETTSGDVKVSGGRDVHLRTVSGDIRLEGAVDANAQSVSGNLTLRGVAHQSHLRTVSGDIAWDGSCGSGCRFEATTVSGDLQLSLDPSSSFQLDFRSRSGDFSDGFGAAVHHAGRDGVHTQVGKGEGAISFHSVSGDLRLARR
jgi:hypothetical protein